MPVFSDQVQSVGFHLLLRAGGEGQRKLPGIDGQHGGLDLYLNHPAFELFFAQLCSDLSCQRRDGLLHFIRSDQIPLEGHPSADGFHLRPVREPPHWRVVQPVAGAPDAKASFPQKLLRFLSRQSRQIPDRAYILLFQLFRSGCADEEHISHWQRPEKRFVVFLCHDGGGVRLFVVTAHFGKGLVE